MSLVIDLMLLTGRRQPTTRACTSLVRPILTCILIVTDDSIKARQSNMTKYHYVNVNET